MPVIKSAKKKLRQDIKREKQNKKVKDALKELIKKAKKSKSDDLVKKVSSLADKAAKLGIVHKNKAARIKSSLAKMVVPATPTPTKKKSSKK